MQQHRKSQNNEVDVFNRVVTDGVT